MKTTLSVILITYNEADNIGPCLDSVGFADEIIVVDRGSEDATVDIAQAKGARVIVTDDWPGYGPQKNRALDLASCDWVLSIDADERVTPELAQAIQDELRNPMADAYKMARLSNFCGRWIRHSGWWPDYVVRLFKRGTARFTESIVHERVDVSGPVAVLPGHFLHYAYPDLETLLTKTNRYSSGAAVTMHSKGRRATLFGAMGHSIWTFIRIYLIRRGFLDGQEGFILAVGAAHGSFFRYSKLWLLSRRQ